MLVIIFMTFLLILIKLKIETNALKNSYVTQNSGLKNYTLLHYVTNFTKTDFFFSPKCW